MIPRASLTVEAATDLLERRRISPQRLSELGAGSIGVTLNPHFLLNEDGSRSGWIVKRLRSARYPDPAATFELFQREHHQVERFFGGTDGRASLLPRTYFITLPENLDPKLGADYCDGPEYAIVQQYVVGVTVAAATSHQQRGLAHWLRAGLTDVIRRYRAMQRQARTIIDCFSVRSEHLRVDELHRRLVFIDTNNLVVLSDELGKNPLFRSFCAEDPRNITVGQLGQVYRRIQRELGFESPLSSDIQDAGVLRQARELEWLVKWFPADGSDNRYLVQLGRLLSRCGKDL